MMRIEGKLKPGTEIDVKRFHLPGVVLIGKCPECGTKYVFDFAVNYLSYPIVGDKAHTCWCSECDHEWDVGLKFGITLELA